MRYDKQIGPETSGVAKWGYESQNPPPQLELEGWSLHDKLNLIFNVKVLTILVFTIFKCTLGIICIMNCTQTLFY